MDLRIEYTPLEWQERVHIGDWSHSALVGGLGSGKTTVALREIQALMIENPGFTYLIGRKTMPSLRDTAMKSFFGLMEPGFIKEHNKTHNDVKAFNESEVIFRGLDDLEKFKSLEIAGFFLNEANEVDKDLYNTLKSRVRQKINGRPPTRYRTIIDLNPTDETHWIPQLFEHEKPSGHQIFYSNSFQNQANLPDGYVEELLRTYTPDMAQRMVWGQFGRVHKGLPVFSQYARDPNQYLRRLEPVVNAPIFVGIDFGFNHPAWVWLQFVDGQARVLAEKLGSKVYLEDFIGECQEYATGLWGPWPWGYKYFCDPRGSDESDKGKTSIEILNEAGIHPLFRRTYIEQGLKAMKWLMDTKTNGEPNFLLHHRCAILHEGLKGGYHRLDGEDSPNKDGYFEHLMDATRYALIHLTRRFKLNKAQASITNSRVYIDRTTGRRIEY